MDRDMDMGYEHEVARNVGIHGWKHPREGQVRGQ